MCADRAAFLAALGAAEVVDHNVEYGEEGVHIEHKESVPFPSGSVSKPTLIRGHLSLKLRPNNSHQAFKITADSWARIWNGYCITSHPFAATVISAVAQAEASFGHEGSLYLH